MASSPPSPNYGFDCETTTVDLLKAELRVRNCLLKGNKEELIQRIRFDNNHRFDVPYQLGKKTLQELKTELKNRGKPYSYDKARLVTMLAECHRNERQQMNPPYNLNVTPIKSPSSTITSECLESVTHSQSLGPDGSNHVLNYSEVLFGNILLPPSNTAAADQTNNIIITPIKSSVSSNTLNCDHKTLTSGTNNIIVTPIKTSKNIKKVVDIPSILLAAHREGYHYICVFDDGQPIVGKLSSDPKGKVSIDQNGNKYTSALDFARKLAPKMKISNQDTRSRIFLSVEASASRCISIKEYEDEKSNIPLQEGTIKTDVKSFLKSHMIDSIKNLHIWFSKQEDHFPRFLFRTLKLGEDIKQGLHSHGRGDNGEGSGGGGGGGGGSDQPNVVDFCCDMFNHITNNVKGFISTTSSAAVATWWSRCFVSPVAVIETSRLDPETCRFWNVATAKDMFPSNKKCEYFGEKSAQYVIDGYIPPGAISIYVPEMQSLKVASFGAAAANLPETLKGLEPVKKLRGNSEALKVKDNNGKFYVLKQGRGGKNPHTSLLHGGKSHCSAEFFALKCYDLFGASIPSAALYRVFLHDKKTMLNELVFVLLTEFIEGPSSLESANALKSLRKHAWLDLAIANFDVCGVGNSNLIQKDGKVYRVDVGCNLAFSADGTGNNAKTIPLNETSLRDFRDPASSRSNATTSKVKPEGKNNADSSGACRAKLLGPALNDRSLASQVRGLDLQNVRLLLNQWMWQQPGGFQSLWVDMADDLFWRASRILSLVTPTCEAIQEEEDQGGAEESS